VERVHGNALSRTHAVENNLSTSLLVWKVEPDLRAGWCSHARQTGPEVRFHLVSTG